VAGSQGVAFPGAALNVVGLISQPGDSADLDVALRGRVVQDSAQSSSPHHVDSPGHIAAETHQHPPPDLFGLRKLKEMLATSGPEVFGRG